MKRYRLFTGISQGSQPFSTWWTKNKEQAAKCNWDSYNTEQAARGALLFQTSNVKLRKKRFVENSDIENVVKLGLAYKQTEAKSDQLENNIGSKGDYVRRVVQEEVAQLNIRTLATKVIKRPNATCAHIGTERNMTVQKNTAIDVMIVGWWGIL